jgi:hypothetical protein
MIMKKLSTVEIYLEFDERKKWQPFRDVIYKYRDEEIYVNIDFIESYSIRERIRTIPFDFITIKLCNGTTFHMKLDTFNEQLGSNLLPI